MLRSERRDDILAQLKRSQRYDRLFLCLTSSHKDNDVEACGQAVLKRFPKGAAMASGNSLKEARPRVFSAIILGVVLVVLSACSPTTTVVEVTRISSDAGDVRVANISESQTVESQLTQVKDFDQCDSTSPFKAEIQFSDSSSQTSQRELVLTGAGGVELGLPSAVRVTLEGAIEQYIGSSITNGQAHGESVSIEVLARSHQEYQIVWRETRREGTVQYIENGETKTANYSYRIGLELVSSTGRDLSCSGQTQADTSLSSESIAEAPTSVPQAIEAPTSSVEAQPAPTVEPDIVYQADWSQGFDGWAGDETWKVLNGMLLNDGQQKFGSVIKAPFRPGEAGIANYMIVADMQLISIEDAGSIFSCFGMIGRSIYFLGIKSKDREVFYSKQFPAWGYGFEIEKSDFDPGNEWHTYKLIVEGNNIRYMIDDRPFLNVTDNESIEGGEISLFSNAAQISIRNFRVIALK